MEDVFEGFPQEITQWELIKDIEDLDLVITMEDLFEGFPQEITQWELIRDLQDLDLVEKPIEPPERRRMKLLSRRDVLLHGTIPTMEDRIYSQCKECMHVFDPRHIKLHNSCVGKSSNNQNIMDLKKIESKKKSHSQSLPAPPLFKKPTSPLPMVSSPICDLKNPVSTVIPMETSVIKEKEWDRDKEREKDKDGDREKEKDRDRHRERDKERDKEKEKDRDREKERDKSKEKDKEGHSDMKEVNISSPPSTTSSTGSPSTSSRYKKSKRSNKVTKEYDPDVHCGVIEGNKGPCTRSITCSNHRIQLRKLVLGRSKDIHQLISERKAAKEKDMKNSGCSYTPLNLEEKEIFCQNTSYVPPVTAIVSIDNSVNSPNTTTYVPIMPKTSEMTVPNSSPHSRQTTSLTSTSLSKEINSVEPVTIASTKPLENGYNSPSMQNNSQKGAVGTVPVVYMPMSPISVFSPFQFVEIRTNMICLESPQSAMSPPLPNQSVYYTIPETQSSVKMYRSRPKPISISSFGTRKVSGAILMSNQRVKSQRNDILTAINPKRKTNAQQDYKAVSLLNNTHHRPNILKVKSFTKVNSKRPAQDKLNASDSKQIRLTPDVNGFILYADMSETADAPQPNNCIQEKIALLNM